MTVSCLLEGMKEQVGANPIDSDTANKKAHSAFAQHNYEE